MHILEHLFLVGEFPERAHLLSGLRRRNVITYHDPVGRRRLTGQMV